VVEYGKNERGNKQMDVAKLQWRIKVETFIGWLSYLCLAVIVGSMVYEVKRGEIIPATLILRGVIAVPFTIWYGHRCLSTAKELKNAITKHEQSN
jgi:hypothetical protein